MPVFSVTMAGFSVSLNFVSSRRSLNPASAPGSMLAFSGSVAVQPDVAVIYVMVPEFQSLSTDELTDV